MGVSERILIKFRSNQFSDFLLSYNKLSEQCFTDCVKDFTGRLVKPDEVGAELQSVLDQ